MKTQFSATRIPVASLIFSNADALVRRFASCFFFWRVGYLPFSGAIEPVHTASAAKTVLLTHRTIRRAFTLVEMTVALLLFGLSISALFPLVVSYSKTMESLEQRPRDLSLHRTSTADNYNYRTTHGDEWYRVGTPPYTKTTSQPNAGEWVHKWYLKPFSDSATGNTVKDSDGWARKLGAGSTVTFEEPSITSSLLLNEPTKDDSNDSTQDDVVGPLDADDNESNSLYVEAVPADWTNATSSAAYGNTYRKQQVAEATTAVWTLTVVEEGWYQVQATGFISGVSSSGGNYTVGYGTGPTYDAVSIPSDKMFGLGTGVEWTALATKYFPAGTVTVQLNADATKTAIADGIRLVRCSVQIQTCDDPTVAAPNITVKIQPAKLVTPP